MTIRRLALAVMGACVGSAFAASAHDACVEDAKTELEALYCTVVSEGQGAGLPSPTDFKRNDPQVQALLLRRPAGRLGLEVPQPGTSATADSRTQSEQADPEPEVAEPEDNPPADSGQLADCRLEGQRISCPGRRFELAINQSNNKLANGVLEPDNRLGLSSFEGNRNDEEAVRRYLSDAYDRYIPKMVNIGLGANTMSFTAFHNAFHTMEDGGVDFARRMERTFTLLKQDKKHLAVKSRYHDEVPDDLSLCTFINRDILVCDNVGTNWVYVSRSR
ncbi:hypothetical protein [Marinobacter vulgaris]|uniref:hypothetical protein n=1 Tax=Marinobacter vulgaris TaxID=1928331 RepID=UPI001D0DA9F0|nr:hypothetical protein [Marinobacter vulgaris]